jgi:cell division transport system permease protein
VRPSRIICALLLVVCALAGCGLFGHDPAPTDDEKLQQLIDKNPVITVFVAGDVTTAQRRDIEAALRALPGVAEVSYLDHEAAHRKMQRLFSDEPQRMPSIPAEDLPESFEARMTDIAAVEKVRDRAQAMKNAPGVQDVIVPCTTVAECRERMSRTPAVTPT